MKVIQHSTLKGKLDGKPHILFSIKDSWYYVIVKNGSQLNEFSLVAHDAEEPDIVGIEAESSPPDWLLNFFDEDLYHTEYIDVNSSFYEEGYQVSDGNPTYFYLKSSSGAIYGESKLTTIISPNPIDTRLYNYLLSETLTIAQRYP